MKILHLFSNHKFTGPADPALVLARALCGEEFEVTWAAASAPDGSPSLLDLGRGRGLLTAAGLRLRKHGRPLPWIHDVIVLRRWLREKRFDLVHTHLPNDHHIATVAARGLDVPVVRSLYDLDSPRGRRARTSIKRSRALLAPTERAAERLRESYPELAESITVVPPPLDIVRFRFPRDPERRTAWNAKSGDFVVGVVARMQTHRRFAELIDGFAQSAREDPGLHLVILGRGTNQRIVAHEPAARSGVADQIHFPGYVDPAEYPLVLPAFDALIFLVPGSDGTCRAVREAQACGVPVIAAARGLLPELIVPGETGILLEIDEPRAIAAAIQALRGAPRWREELAQRARGFAEEKFGAVAVAEQVRRVYRRLLGGSTP